MPRITFLRGLPGAGKSTYALGFLRHDVLIEAAQYLYDEHGQYVWTPERCASAHGSAQVSLLDALIQGKNIVVANTFSRFSELDTYRRLVPREYTQVIIDLFDSGLTDAQLSARCIHHVPVEKIGLMRARWEPLPPSEWRLERR